jgi:hypothetical protein
MYVCMYICMCVYVCVRVQVCVTHLFASRGAHIISQVVPRLDELIQTVPVPRPQLRVQHDVQLERGIDASYRDLLVLEPRSTCLAPRTSDELLRIVQERLNRSERRRDVKVTDVYAFTVLGFHGLTRNGLAKRLVLSAKAGLIKRLARCRGVVTVDRAQQVYSR